MWYSFVAGVFGVGCVFVVLMYIKDAKSIRWFWAAKLAILRIAVYAILCFVFLLPAKQTWERTEKRSRVVVVLDISPSMTRTSDEIDSRGRAAKTRMDVLLDFLADDKNATRSQFIQKILEQEPDRVYSFGTARRQLTNDERDEAGLEPRRLGRIRRYDFRPAMLKGLSADGQQKLRAPLSPSLDRANDSTRSEETGASQLGRLGRDVGRSRQQRRGGKQQASGRDKRKPDRRRAVTATTTRLCRQPQETRSPDRRGADDRAWHQRARLADGRAQSRVGEHGAGDRRLLRRPQQPRLRVVVPRTPRPRHQGEDPHLHGRGRRRSPDHQHQHQRDPGRRHRPARPGVQVGGLRRWV